MDGSTLTRELRQLLGETVAGTWLDSQTTYDYLYQAAVATSSRISFPTTYQSITTVADQADYYLNGDFLKLFRKDSGGRFFIKYYDGTNYSFINWKDYDEILLANQTDSVLIPSVFTIRGAPPLTRLTGTVTAAGALSNGECTLTDSSAPFTNVYAGDIVHNTTDASSGIVISKISTSALVTCLFGGTDNDWDFNGTDDAYILNPQARFYLTFDPPPSTAGHTVTVYHVQKPTPVYSSYRSYPFPTGFSGALARYAAWLYKYRDSDPNFGDGWFKYWDTTVRQFGREMNQGLNRKGFSVSFMKD